MVATLNLLCQEIQTAARCLDGWIQNKGAVILLCVTVGRGRTTLMMEEPLGDCWHPAVSRSLSHTCLHPQDGSLSLLSHFRVWVKCQLCSEKGVRTCEWVSEWVSEADLHADTQTTLRMRTKTFLFYQCRHWRVRQADVPQCWLVATW